MEMPPENPYEGLYVPTDMECVSCSWSPKDPTMFRFVKQPLCIECGSPMLTVAARPDPPKTSWGRLMADKEDFSDGG